MRSVLLAILWLLATEGAHGADLPLFVVERSRVIWPQKCPRSATPVPAELQSRMRKELGERGVLVGKGRVEEVTLGAPECMPGECGNGQFAVPLISRGAERTGLFLPAGKVDVGALRPLALQSVEGTDPHGLRPGLPTPVRPPPSCGDPPPGSTAGLLVTCLTYVEASGARGIQVQGRGRLQQNGLPDYEVARFRILEADEAKDVPGPWHDQSRGKGTRLPVPLALLPGNGSGSERVLWLRQEGICCPSAASAWVSDLGAHVSDGPRHVAGFGQSCD